MIRYMRIVLASASVELRQQSFAILVSASIWPLEVSVVAMYMLRHRVGFDATAVVVGSTLMGQFSIVVFAGIEALTRERSLGNLEFLEAAPAPLSAVVSGKIVSGLAFVVPSAAVSYAVAAWMFGYSVPIRDPRLLIVAVPIALFALWCFGMLLAPISLMWPSAASIIPGLEYPLYIFSGFLFPITLLPNWLRYAAYGLTTYWAASALHRTSWQGAAVEP